MDDMTPSVWRKSVSNFGEGRAIVRRGNSQKHTNTQNQEPTHLLSALRWRKPHGVHHKLPVRLINVSFHDNDAAQREKSPGRALWTS